MARLMEYEQQRVERAKQALAASQADKDAADYPRHLGALEVDLADMIRLVERLSGSAS
jgi:hypothetical protein